MKNNLCTQMEEEKKKKNESKSNKLFTITNLLCEKKLSYINVPCLPSLSQLIYSTIYDLLQGQRKCAIYCMFLILLCSVSLCLLFSSIDYTHYTLIDCFICDKITEKCNQIFQKFFFDQQKIFAL